MTALQAIEKFPGLLEHTLLLVRRSITYNTKNLYSGIIWRIPLRRLLRTPLTIFPPT